MSRRKDWNIDLYFVTWNVGTKYPENIVLDGLLGLEKLPQNDKLQPDFYIIGLQEVSSQPQNIFVNLFKADPWTKKFKKILKKRDYVVVKAENLQGLLLIIFAKRRHIMHLRDIETEFTRTGLGGVWGNKGAVSVRFNAYGNSVCVVNAHLAAHDNKLDERVEDYNQIVKDHKFHVKHTKDIFSHDYVFWLGDLNFRIKESYLPNAEDIVGLIQRDQLKDLLENDQLVIVRNQRRAFQQLTEKLPQFPPTFKFEEGTNVYDLKRRPAWCDRVLYKVSHENETHVKLSVEQTSYKSHPTYSISDHKPVTSEFTIKVDTTVEEKTVTFTPIALWTSGAENVVEYELPAYFEEQEADWVGIYKENFTSLDSYKAWQYTGRETDDRRREVNQIRTLKLTFPDTISLQPSKKYRLLYFQNTGPRGVSAMVGMSDPFPVQKRSHTPGPDDID